MRPFECPKCGRDISDSYVGDDPDTGIRAGWYCDSCDEALADDDSNPNHFLDES